MNKRDRCKEMVDTKKHIQDFIEVKEVTREHIVQMVNSITLKERKSVSSNSKSNKKEPTKK